MKGLVVKTSESAVPVPEEKLNPEPQPSTSADPPIVDDPPIVNPKIVHRHPQRKRVSQGVTQIVKVGLTPGDGKSKMTAQNLSYTVLEPIKNKKPVPAKRKRLGSSDSDSDECEDSDENCIESIDNEEGENGVSKESSIEVIDCENSENVTNSKTPEPERIEPIANDEDFKVLFEECAPNLTKLVSLVNAPSLAYKRGRKRKDPNPDEVETPKTEIVLVMPPKDAKIVKYNVVGRRQPILESGAEINPDLNRKYYYDVQRCDLNQFTGPRKKRVQLDTVPADTLIKQEPTEERTTAISAMTEFRQQVAKKARDLRPRMVAFKKLQAARKLKLLALKNSVKDRKAPIKKPKMFSLNPFCLPVSLLDLDEKPKW